MSIKDSRWIRAFKFNEPQITANVILVLFSVCALLSREDVADIPLYVYFFVSIIFPLVSYIANVKFDSLSKNKESKNKS